MTVGRLCLHRMNFGRLCLWGWEIMITKGEGLVTFGDYNNAMWVLGDSDYTKWVLRDSDYRPVE